jgi:hypothetical protein
LKQTDTIESISNFLSEERINKLSEDFADGKIVLQGVGFRYGEGPSNGKSYNTRDNKYENGYSMASVSGLPESRSFATESAKKRGIFYYEGDIVGFGSDDEPIMANGRKISKKEYESKYNSLENLKTRAIIQNRHLMNNISFEKNWRDPTYNEVLTNPFIKDVIKSRDLYEKTKQQLINSVAPANKPLNQTETPAFKKWFGDSKVVDSEGKPLVVYHGTNVEVEAFSHEHDKTFKVNSASYSGYWFTDSEAEGTIYSDVAVSSRGGKNFVHKVFLKMINPKSITENDLSDYKSDKLMRYKNMLDDLRDAENRLEFEGVDSIDKSILGITPLSNSENDVESAIRNKIKETKHKIDSYEQGGSVVQEEMSDFIEEAKQQGHDGVIFEGEGNNASNYLIFEPNQIKSATGNNGAFDANDTRIDFSDTIEAAPLTGTVLPQISRLTAWLESHGYKEKAEQLATYFWDQDASITARQKELGELPESQDYDMKKRLMGKRIADEVELFNREKVKPIQAEMAANGLKTIDVDELLHADHAPERNLQMKRINARRYLDAIIGNMTDAEAEPYQSMIYDIGDELDAAGLFNGDISVLNEKRDAYIGMLDALSLDVSSISDTEQQKIDALQDKLSNREFTAEEIENGTQARKQKEIDNKQKRLDQRISIAETWEDVKDRLSGMTNEKSKEIQDKWAGNTAIKSVADKLRKINSDAFDMMHNVGELTDEEYEAMGAPYQFHVPLMREGFPEGKAATGMSGYGPLGKPIKLAVGSTRKVIDITANIIDRYQSEINRKHKLDASRALYEMVSSNPDENRWGIIKQKKVPRLDDEGNIRYFNENPRNLEDNEVFVKVDGQLYKIGVPFDNPSMMRWMEAIKRTPTELGPFLKSSQKIVRFLAGLNTSFSPEFLPSNFIRDLPVAMIHLESINGAEGAQRAVLKHIKAAIKGICQSERGDNTSEMAKLFRDFAKHGGKVGWMQGYDSVAELAKNFEKELAFEEGKHPGMDKLKKLGKWITDVNTAVENGVRLSAYKVMIDGGMSKLKAATAASGLTIDFTQHGTAGPIINSLYMFANAGIQGNVRMIKALNTPKIRKLAAAIVGFGAMASIMGVMVGGDDDDGEPYYDKLKRTNPSLFERNMVFMVPGSKGKYFKIPMPYGYNAFFVLGNEIAGVIRGQSPIDSMSRIGSVLMNVLNPLASATLLQTIMPTIGDPIAQVMENKSWAGGALMPEKSPFGIPTPDSERYFKSVNPALKSVAQWVNSVTGGNKYKPGLIDVSPETLEMVVETFTGSAGRLAKDALFLPTSAVTGDLEMNKVPFVRRVFGGTSEKINAGIYRENNDKVDILIKQIKDADVSERGELAKNPLSQMIAFHKNTESRMLKLNKMNKIAEKLGREENVKKNDEEMMRLKMQYNKRFNQLTNLK